MKKVLAIILAVVMIIGLAACGSNSSRWWDKTVREYAQAGYELVCEYNRGKISKEDAIERAERLSANIENVVIEEKDELIMKNKKSMQDLMVTLMSGFAGAIRTGRDTVQYETDIKKWLDEE